MAERTQSHTPGPNKFPARYLQFQKRFPKVFQAYDALGAATAEAGPVSGQTRGPGGIGLPGGGRKEGGGEKHTRRARAGSGFAAGKAQLSVCGNAAPLFSCA